jgi:hypothetical protein
VNSGLLRYPRLIKYIVKHWEGGKGIKIHPGPSQRNEKAKRSLFPSVCLTFFKWKKTLFLCSVCPSVNRMRNTFCSHFLVTLNRACWSSCLSVSLHPTKRLFQIHLAIFRQAIS